jgi:hypothetical protein
MHVENTTKHVVLNLPLYLSSLCWRAAAAAAALQS